MCNDSELPSDYEPCGECGYDHAYEPEQAFAHHKLHADEDLTEQT